jgi:hypothetical protein
MIKVIVYWDTGEEEYVFENEEDARAFYVDALSKYGQVKFSVQNVGSNDIAKLR